jgi:hypothetical protein
MLPTCRRHFQLSLVSIAQIIYMPHRQLSYISPFANVLILSFIFTGHDVNVSVGGRQFWDKMYWYILFSKCTGTLSIFSAREKFSSDTEMVVGSLLSLAVYISWWYILVGSIFWVCRWIVVSGKSKFVGTSVLSVISWLLLCVQIHLPPLNTTTSSCLWIQALKRYQLSETTCESPYSRLWAQHCCGPRRSC